MSIERNDIKHLMWRKKVDSSLFKGESVVPMAFVKQWELKNYFKDNGKNSSLWPVQIKFGSKIYEGKVSKICQENTKPKIFIFELSKLPSTERAN